jgi:hypothetical protein
VTEFPSDQPAEHPTGFPVESEPEGRPDPETEPGGGEPDFDSEPDRSSTPEDLLRRHPLVEKTTERLEDLRDRPVAGHAEVYADLQERLQAALAEADRPDATERV